VLVGGGLLGDQLQRLRIDSITPVDPSNSNSPGYGLAIARFGPMLGHDGSLPGYQSFMGHDADNRTTLVIVATLQFGPAGEEPANQLAMTIIDQLYGT
jgi:D-alanyl-D-alanine carboxypeptidase